MSTPTTSFRLPAGLRGRLVKHARRTKMARSQVVVQALERYLDEVGEGAAKEARRQSRLASAAGDRDWESVEGDAWPSR